MLTQEEFIYFPEKQLLGFGSGERLLLYNAADFSRMQEFIDAHAGKYIFTCLSYDLKNAFEDLTSEHADTVVFPQVVLWVPDYVVDISTFSYLQGDETLENRSFVTGFYDKIISEKSFECKNTIHFEPRISRETYINSVNKVKQEIQLGNCYELNYCQEFYAEQVPSLDTFSLFRTIYRQTKAPFSVYMQLENWSVMCFSPERYIQKVGTRLLSQPIKGTIRRGKDIEEDAQLKKTLLADKKELSENVMITDLVRNDFSRIAKKGSVEVLQLCELKTFETLHHLVSTIVCEIDPSVTLERILQASFPMGSMTGAPKVRVMQLIEKYEAFRRGLYAGSIGVIFPNRDFDFNVIIRSLLYNKEKEIVSCSVGSAITMKSDPEKEYEECFVKVQKILQFFGGCK